MRRAGHRQIEHTADIALEIWAPSEERLLVEGARAIVELLTGGAAVGSRDERRFELLAIDREDRLVRFLNEVLVLAVPGGFLTADAELTLGEGRLRATLRGEGNAAGRIVTELKSVTYHDLSVLQDAAGWRARVVVDV